MLKSLLVLFSLVTCGIASDTFQRRDILIDDFEKGYEKWTVKGSAFGNTPATIETSPAKQMDLLKPQGKGFVNSYKDGLDEATGSMLSKKFIAQRDFITLYVYGGDFKGESCVNLIIDGKIVASLLGENENHFKKQLFDLRKYQGKAFQLEIVDNNKKSWGVIGVDHILMTDDADGLLALDKAVSLFDGKTLKGWKVINAKDKDLWSVDDGVIKGKSITEKLTILRTEKEFQNFEFSCLFKLDESDSNSSNLGILYRAYGRDYVIGYQAGLSSDRLGNINDENRRGLLNKPSLKR